ncbi:MAG: hypothetical protein V3R68_07665 [Gammaproteobacteria bacterium]
MAELREIRPLPKVIPIKNDMRQRQKNRSKEKRDIVEERKHDEDEDQGQIDEYI